MRLKHPELSKLGIGENHVILDHVLIFSSCLCADSFREMEEPPPEVLFACEAMVLLCGADLARAGAAVHEWGCDAQPGDGAAGAAGAGAGKGDDEAGAVEQGRQVGAAARPGAELEEGHQDERGGAGAGAGAGGGPAGSGGGEVRVSFEGSRTPPLYSLSVTPTADQQEEEEEEGQEAGCRCDVFFFLVVLFIVIACLCSWSWSCSRWCMCSCLCSCSYSCSCSCSCSCSSSCLMSLFLFSVLMSLSLTLLPPAGWSAVWARPAGVNSAHGSSKKSRAPSWACGCGSSIRTHSQRPQ
eukprot:COSAG04_NODE_761_length_10520_cov_3.835428_12_plen_297_part_00